MAPLGRPRRLCGCTTSLWEGPGCGEGPGNSCRSTSGEATRDCLLVNHCMQSSSKLGDANLHDSHVLPSGTVLVTFPLCPAYSTMHFTILASCLLSWRKQNAAMSLRGGLPTGVLPLWLLLYLNIIWSTGASLKSFDNFQPCLMDQIVVENKNIYNCDVDKMIKWRLPMPYGSP